VSDRGFRMERRRGIGTALLQAAEDECRRRGSELLEINVDGPRSSLVRGFDRRATPSPAAGTRGHWRDLVGEVASQHASTELDVGCFVHERKSE